MVSENQNWSLKDTVEAIEEVRDPDKEASDYEFWDKLEKTHPAPPKKGNDGLSSIVPYLAIYRENGDLEKDEDLIRIADEKLTQEHATPIDRTRTSNIVEDSENRPKSKESLEDNEVDGHSRLIEMFEDFYEEIGEKEKYNQILKDSDLSLDSNNGDISYEPKSFIIRNGGEIMTTIEEMAEGIEESVDEMYEMLDSLPREEVYDELRSDLDELKDKAEAAKDDYFEVRGELSATQSELETVYDSLESAHERVEDANEHVDRVATATGHALDDAVSEMESALDEGVNQVDEAQGYMEEILDDDIPEGPDRPDRVEEQLE